VTVPRPSGSEPPKGRFTARQGRGTVTVPHGCQHGSNMRHRSIQLIRNRTVTRTFLGMSLCLAGFSTRKDLLGVTSIVRARGLEPACYARLLDFFHSPALDLDKLTRAWRALVFRFDPGLLRVNGKPVLVGDGIKVAKAGRKMPGVKKLHQESDS